ncbi:MAG: hypothetical protein QM751_10320 [Paludibacteraceae bacterium]
MVLHIAYKKTATADAQENTTNTPDKAVDGDMTTRWAAPNNATAACATLARSRFRTKLCVKPRGNTVV